MPKMMPKLIAFACRRVQPRRLARGRDNPSHPRRRRSSWRRRTHRREDAELELGVVDIDEEATLRSPEEAAELRVGRDVLQIRVGAGVAPGHRAAGMQLSVKAPVDDMAGKRPRQRWRGRARCSARV